MEPYPAIPPALDQIVIENREEAHARQVPLRASKSLSPDPKADALLDKIRCSHSAKIPLILLDKHSFFKRRIMSLQMKERLLACKKLKALGQQTQRWIEYRMHHKVFYKKEEPASPLSDPFFRQSQEERQFVIQRIIRYLADI
jgi:hypothetical protein